MTRRGGPLTDANEDSAAGSPVLFVSYAREDRELCRRLALMLSLVLESRGYDVWYDEALGGGRWRDQIEAAIERAVASVLLVTPHSLKSKFVMEVELPQLLSRGVVAPVYGSRCRYRRFPEIAALQFLGGTSKPLGTLDDARGELAAALSAIAEQAPGFLSLPPRVTGSGQPGSLPPDAAQLAAGVAMDLQQPGELHGVPELPDGYFERSAELGQLRGQLLTGGSGHVGLTGRPLFGLYGAGGIGKSVLAAAMARDPIVRRAFPDGVYWVVLGERPDPVAAQAALARMLNVDAGFRTAEDGRAALRRALEHRRVLVVVDDAWSAADAEGLLVTDLSGRTVLTTRHTLVLDRVHADQVMIDRLGLDDARRFLAHVVGRREQLPVEADDLIEAVGGVVLALALIGATISRGTTWHDAKGWLDAAADVYHDDNFANQFKGMQVAWTALDDEARCRYAELAVFGPDTTIPMDTVTRLWRHTAGLDDDDTRRLCAELAERNLVVAGDGVRFHGLQRAFLELHTPDSASAHRRLLDAHVPPAPQRWSSLPDDEPYLWEHLIEHLVGAGDVGGLQTVLTDPVWLLRRYHLQGAHAPESDLVRGLDALPTFATGERLLHRLRQVSHLLGSLSTLGDRALTLAAQINDIVNTNDLTRLFPAVTLTVPANPAVRDEALERVIPGHAGVWAVAWSPDGRRLAAAGVDGTLRIWQTDAAGRQAASLGADQPCAMRSLAWSPDGRRVAAGADDGKVRIWDTQMPQVGPVELNGHDACVWSVAWSRDGRRLASAGSDAAVRIWEPDQADPLVCELIGHDGTVWSVTWSPDGRRVASGGADHTVRTWTVTPAARRPRLLGKHDGWVRSVAWSPDGTQIASGGDKTVLVWDAKAPGKAAARLVGHNASVWTVAWSPDGRQLASGSTDASVRVWDTASPAEHIVLDGHTWHVWSVAWSPDGTRLASGSEDTTVRVWQPATAQRRAAVEAPLMRWIWSVAWSPDGRRLATGSEDGPIRVWQPDTPDAPAMAVADIDGGIWAVAWSADGARLAAAGADRLVRIWDAPFAASPPRQLVGHAGLIRSITWSPDGHRLASVADDGTVRIWDLTEQGTQAVLLTGEGDEMRSRSVSWSPHGDRLVTGCDDGTVRIWDPHRAGQHPTVWPGHVGRVESVAWSPNGQLVASGGYDGTVRWWDAQSPASPTTLVATHAAPVEAIAWSLDGRWLASGSDDGTVQLTDVASARPAVNVALGSDVCSLAWHGRRIAAGMATTWTLLSLHEATGTGPPP